MFNGSGRGAWGFALALAIVGFARAGAAATTGANGSHDPSRIIESDGRFYFCSTGGRCASSADGLAWVSTGLRINVPSWAAQAVGGATQGVWAPDIVRFNGQFYIYYSFCSAGAASVSARACAVGLYTTPTLDSTSARYELTDAGLVVTDGGTGGAFSTIDPGPIVDPDGNLWTSWGSGFGHDFSKTQLWLTRLDAAGLPLASDPSYKPPAAPGYALQTGRKEASYLYFHQGSYYLFYNTGGCCAGTASTYTIWVARAPSITGPFTGDRIFFESQGDIHGPGHMGIYDDCGFQRFTYHYYPTDTSILGENELSWGSDGWPAAGPESTTPLKACGSNGGGGVAGGGGHASAGASGGAAGGRGGGGGAAGRSGPNGGAGATGNSGGGSASDGQGGGGSAGASSSAGATMSSGAGGMAGQIVDAGVASGAGAPGQTSSTAGCSCSAWTSSPTTPVWGLPFIVVSIMSAAARRRRNRL